MPLPAILFGVARGVGSLAASAGRAGLRFGLRSNLTDVLADLEDLERQVKFALAKSLTDTARDIAVDVRKAIDTSLDRPSPFTRNAIYTTPARITRLEAVVGIKDAQVEYLRYQVEGGRRSPTRRALRLPSVVERDQYGNVPISLVRQLVARARAGKRATKVQSRRLGVRQSAPLFYGNPGGGRPPGVYQRVERGAKDSLVPIVVFPQQAAFYRSRLDFYGVAKASDERHWQKNFDAALKLARRTAR